MCESKTKSIKHSDLHVAYHVNTEFSLLTT